MSVRIANGQGFWGDWLEAPVRLVEQGPIDFLALDYLAEITMSILQKQKQPDQPIIRPRRKGKDTYGHEYWRIALGDVAFTTSITPNPPVVITAVRTMGAGQWEPTPSGFHPTISHVLLCPCV